MTKETLKRNHDDILWLAGWLEGEGCFSTNSDATICISAGCTDVDVIEKVARIFGTDTIHIRKRPNPKHKPMYRTEIYAENAELLMKVIYPYMGARRQARITELLKFREERLVLASELKSAATKKRWADPLIKAKTLENLKQHRSCGPKQSEAVKRSWITRRQKMKMAS